MPISSMLATPTMPIRVTSIDADFIVVLILAVLLAWSVARAVQTGQ
jgi:hypothetical protein